MRLTQLLNSLKYTLLAGNAEVEVHDIVYDSRKAKDGAVFLCLEGSRSDGHSYVPAAYEAGVRAFVCQYAIPGRAQGESLEEAFPGATFCKVNNTRYALALMAAHLFDYPAKKLKTIAVTGTKGKTSHSFMVRAILEAAGHRVGIIGSIGVLYPGHQRELPNTTPESYEIHKILAEMLAAGCTHVVMEASSTGFFLHRTAGLLFDVGVFTNLTPDHIAPDEHPTFEHYREAKRQLFSQCKQGVINADDPHAAYMAEGAPCPLVFFGVRDDAAQTGSQSGRNSLKDTSECFLTPRSTALLAPQYLASNISFEQQAGALATHFDCTTPSWQQRLVLTVPGTFSVYNALSALAATDVLAQVPPEAVAAGLKSATVLGRMELVPTPEGTPYTVMIDYAHNAVSTKSLLDSIKLFAKARIICVFGCGGNRATGRREGMGRAAGENADLCIITSDNPRRENPLDIIYAVEEGVKAVGGTYERVPNRREAIYHALSLAKQGDIVLIMGKGHERFQEINDEFFPFDEREVVAAYYRKEA